MDLKIFTHNNGFGRLFFSLFILLSVTSCQKDPVREKLTTPEDPSTPVSYKSGIFIINEGNFNWGNASVNFIDKQSDSVYSNIFEKANNCKLGDVAQEMKVFGDKGYIVVNVSNKIEVVDLEKFTLQTTITGLNSPRSIRFVNSRKAYVTNLLGDISVVDLNTNSVTGKISTANWTENMVLYDKYMYVSAIGKYSDPNSVRRAKILVIDTDKDAIVDSIKSGKEPMGIVIDRKEKVWVLCTGGFDNFEAPSLIRIDPVLRIVEKTFTFQGEGVPSRLCINETGDTIYFLRNGVYKMPVTSQEIPAQPFIAANGRLLYGLDIEPSSGDIYTSDAVDYVQDGWVYRYNEKNGQLIESYKAGRIPASFCFKTLK